MQPSYTHGADSNWLQSVLNQGQQQAGQFSPNQLFRPGTFENLASNLDRSLHFAPNEIVQPTTTTAYHHQASSGGTASTYSPSHDTTYAPLTFDPALEAMAQAYLSVASGLHEGSGDSSQEMANSDGSYLYPLDEYTTFSSSSIRSILVCGPPGQGKTETIKIILHRLSLQMDGLLLITKTQETIPWFMSTMPMQYIKTHPDSEMLMALLALFEKYQATSQRKCIWGVVIDDVLVSEKDRRDASRGWLTEYILRAHRAGIQLIIGCHKATHVWGGNYNEISIKMQLGLVDNYATEIHEFWAMFCKTQFPSWEDFVEVYRKAVTDKGQCFVVQNVSGRGAIGYWRPPQITGGIIFGHRDWWISTHMWTDPERYYIVNVDKEGKEHTAWPPIAESSGQSSGPSLELLRKQQVGIDVDKELSKLISIDPAPSAGAKKGRPKRTSALRKPF